MCPYLMVGVLQIVMAKVLKKEPNYKWNSEATRGSVAYQVQAPDGSKMWYKPDDGKNK